jgi:hypothetical protein
MFPAKCSIAVLVIGTDMRRQPAEKEALPVHHHAILPVSKTSIVTEALAAVSKCFLKEL